jgi:hypothetical protein
MNWLCFDASCGASEMADWIKFGFTGVYAQTPDVGASLCTGPDPQKTLLVPPTCLGEKAGQNTSIGNLEGPLCTDANAAIGRDFTLPLYDKCVAGGTAAACTTSGNNQFHISGFGRFTFMGIRFNDSNGKKAGCYVNTKVKDLPDCPGGASSCIWGKFKTYVGFGDILPGGGSCNPNIGTCSVVLTN